MKIPNIEQIRAWDAYTIREEPVASLELMERAANAFVRWFVGQFSEDNPVRIFCGTGNNGGDGLAIARLLRNRFYDVEVVLCGPVERLSPDAHTNHNRLVKMHTVPIHHWVEGESLPEVPAGAVVVDALFGSGLNRPVEGALARLLEHLNALP
ncbi:MAG: NAD(P)H-hydrate epimerase, partial [Bacteroidetes bacterium]